MILASPKREYIGGWRDDMNCEIMLRRAVHACYRYEIQIKQSLIGFYITWELAGSSCTSMQTAPTGCEPFLDQIWKHLVSWFLEAGFIPNVYAGGVGEGSHMK